MAINYNRVNWDTTMFVKPTNMNQMDAGIKAACDGVDRLDGELATTNQNVTDLETSTDEEITAINNDLSQINNTLSNKTGTITVASGLTNRGSMLRQFGNVISMEIIVSGVSGDVGSWITVGTISNVKLDTYEHKLMGIDRFTFKPIFVTIQPNGEIRVTSGSALNDSTILILGSWIVQ